MQLRSNVDFDPLCSSGMYVVNGQDAQPSSNMVWNPCLNPKAGSTCCCNCFRIEFPGLVSISGEFTPPGSLSTAPAACIIPPVSMTMFAIAPPCGAPWSPGSGLFGCVWVNPLSDTLVPPVVFYSMVGGSPGPMTLQVSVTWYDVPNTGVPVALSFNATYTLNQMSCAGGEFTLTTSDSLDGFAVTDIYGRTSTDCVGCSAKWPATIMVFPENCSTYTCQNCFQFDFPGSGTLPAASFTLAGPMTIGGGSYGSGFEWVGTSGALTATLKTQGSTSNLLVANGTAGLFYYGGAPSCSNETVLIAYPNGTQITLNPVTCPSSSSSGG